MKVSIVETRFDNERLLLEILSHLDKKIHVHLSRSHKDLQDQVTAYPEKSPDLIILGHHLPDLDANKELTRIRTDWRFDSTPVCVISEYPSASMQSLWRSIGAIECLQSQLKASELRAQLQKIMSDIGRISP